jgi:hypothetical protein
LGNHDQDFGNSIPALHDLKQAENIDTKLKHWTASQRHDQRSLLISFVDVFKDTPGKTTLITHRIKLREGSKSVSCAPYRLNPVTAARIRHAIQEMVGLGIVAPSESPWASPIVVVPKPDSGNGEGAPIRLCTDFRRVNALTEGIHFHCLGWRICLTE